MAKASDAVSKTRRVLQDYDEDRFSDEDILVHVNGARRALAVPKPDVYATIVTVALQPGVRQKVPDDCNVFYEVQAIRDSGGVILSIPTVAQREDLDRYSPSWQLAPAGAADHFMFDERFPGFFFLTPGAKSGYKADIAYAQVPADVALNDRLNAQEALLLDSLSDYAVARCLLDDAQAPVNQQRGAVHLQLFASATGSSLKALMRTSPNVANEGGAQSKG